MATSHKGTKVCAFCKQELAHASYYRHLMDRNGAVCRGKAVKRPTSVSSSDEDSGSDVFSISDRSDNLDTSFDFGSETDISDIADFDQPSEQCHKELDDSQSQDDYEMEDFDSDLEEIWESSDSESVGSDLETASNTNSLAHNVLMGISLFVTAFQLLFRISERAMSFLLLFLRTLMTYLSDIVNHPVLSELSHILPKTLSSAKKLVGKPYDGVTDYVVCPKCNKLYKMSECILKEFGREESRKCSYIEFPNHPHYSRRAKCNTPLLKKVKVGHKLKLVPRKLYQYHSIIHILQQFVQRKDFLNMCEKWRNRSEFISEDTFCDVYDGKVWKELQYINRIPFLAAPHNFCLMMNVDWFNPFDETQYSAGAIYMVIQNLPRAERYKFDNLILVGMIPGPKEPKRDINTFLAPLVDELKKLYRGVTLKNPNSFFGSTTVRALVSCIGSDLPATRKVCGFLSYNAHRGCSKCLKEFATESFGSKPNFSGYDCDSWVSRNITEHMLKAQLVRDAQTASQRSIIEESHGVRYSILLNLPHFDVIRFHTIDPMHCIFLGISKYTVKLWKESNILKERDFEMLQDKVDSMNVPPNIGRIPRKVKSGFASFTADEWKHWILIYSLFALYEVLPTRDYNCWYVFVEACQLLCQSTITKMQVLHAHDLLVKFCKTFEELYGFQMCTPNMHMACHLKDCILDYGPIPAFWCFSFERYNGTMERMSISWQGPEKQMFSKFLNLQYLHTLETSASDSEFFNIVCKQTQEFQATKVHASVELTAVEGTAIANQTFYHTCPASMIDGTEKKHQKLTYPLIEKVFNDSEMCYLQQMYSVLYPSTDYELVEPSRLYLESKQININGEQYISSKSRSERSQAIVAHWPNQVLGIDPTGESPLRAGIISYFFRHEMKLKCKGTGQTQIMNKVHLLARVQWLEDHPYREKYIKTLFVSATTYVHDNSSSFIPVARIAGRCAIAETNVIFDYGEDKVIVCVPLLKNVLI